MGASPPAFCLCAEELGLNVKSPLFGLEKKKKKLKVYLIKVLLVSSDSLSPCFPVCGTWQSHVPCLGLSNSPVCE